MVALVSGYKSNNEKNPDSSNKKNDIKPRTGV